MPAPAPAEARLVYTGRLLDPDGRPVAGAVVEADDGATYQVISEWDETPWRHFVPDPLAAAAKGPGARRSRTPTGPDGVFRVEGVRPPAGKGWIVAVHPSFAATRADGTGRAARDGVVDFGDVRLTPGASVRALVRRADGTPAASAWVVARPAGHIEGQGNWWSEETAGAVRAARTDAEGRATLGGLHVAAYRIGAFDETSIPAIAEAQASRDAAPEVTLTLTPGVRLRIEAVWRGSAEPVAGARVLVSRTNLTGGWSMPGPAPFATLTTGADGLAEAANLPPDEPTFDVRITPPDFAGDGVHGPGPFSVFRRVDAGGTARAELDAPVGIGLAACDAETKALVPGLIAQAHAVWDRYDRTGGDPIDLRGVSEGEAVLFRTIRPGPWSFDLWAPGYHPARIDAFEVRASYQVTPKVELRRATASATGRVVERSTGRPVAGAEVASYEWVQRLGDGQRATVTTGADGAFRLTGLLGEGYPLRLTVTAPGHVSEFPQWDEKGRTAELGAVMLLRAAAVRGRVTDRDGRPLGQVEVELVSPGGRMVTKGDGRSATTDADGRYAFEGLRPGEYVVIGQSQSSPIRLAEGEEFVRDLVR